MNIKKAFLNLIVLLLPLWLILVIGVSAQGPKSGDADINQQNNDITTSGLADSVPTGYEIIYMFSGVRNKSGEVATSVHCTNYDSTNITVVIHFFDIFGSTTYPITETSLAPNRSRTFSTQATQIYGGHEANAAAAAINQGSGRVLATGSKIMCTAMLLDPTGVPLSTTTRFMTGLTLFDQYGNCASSSCIPLHWRVYLPIILKNN